MNSDSTGKQSQTTMKNYVFCHSPSTLKGIIMLANHQTIIDNILKDAVQPHYFWIQEKTLKVQSILKQISEQVRKASLIFSSISLMHQFLQKQNKDCLKKIIIICCPQALEKIQNILRTPKIVGVVVYRDEEHNNHEKQMKRESEDIKKENEWNKNSKITYCYQKTILKRLLEQSSWSFAEEKQFPTFVALKKQVQKSTMLSLVLFAMKKEQYGHEIRKQVLTQLSKCISSLSKFHEKLSKTKNQLKNMTQVMKKNQATYKYIIRFYSSEKHQLYVLLNIFLRGLKCPTQLYYVQPIVRDLFFAIQHVQKNSQKEDFVCYRGGFMTIQEFWSICSAVGEVVQNLGFLSTSKDEDAAASFSSNVIFKIGVKDSPSELIQSGYADISPFSQFMSEEQVLFNPLNYFKVVEVTETIKKSEISPLFFVSMELISSLINKQEKQDQNIRRTNQILKQHSEMNKFDARQIGIILTSEGENEFQKAQIFYTFFKQKAGKQFQVLLISDSEDKNILQQWNIDRQELQQYLKVGEKIGSLLTKNNQVEEGLVLLHNCKRLNKFLQNKFLNLLIDLSIGTNLYQQKKYKQAFFIFLNIIQFEKNAFTKHQKLYLESLNCLGSTLRALNLFEGAMMVFKQSLQLYKQIYGELHSKTQSIMFQIGVLYEKCGQFQKAIELFLKCRDIQKDIIGEDHPAFFDTSYFIALSLNKMGKSSEALKILKKNIDKVKRFAGENSYFYLSNLELMASVLKNSCRLKEAFKIKLI